MTGEYFFDCYNIATFRHMTALFTTVFPELVILQVRARDAFSMKFKTVFPTSDGPSRA